MKEYFKYLIKNPSRLLFSLGVSIFSITLLIVIFILREEFIAENSPTLFVFSETFMLLLFFVGNYQVYKEWEDGHK
jgi:hypothetical protein